MEGEGTEKDPATAYKWCVKGAENDDPVCLYYAGYCCENGLGTEKDMDQAVTWYRRAAQMGHIMSREIVEKMTGEKVKIVEKESPFQAYLRSAENGDADAMFFVGRCYQDGVGTEKNQAKASEWIEKSAAAGNAAAKRIVAQMGRR